MAEESTEAIPNEAWVRASAVRVVRHNEAVVPVVLDAVLNGRAFVLFGNWRQVLLLEVGAVVLLSYQAAETGAHFL